MKNEMSLARNYTLTIKHQLVILLFLAIGLNSNTLSNGYAVDDVVVLSENSLVQKGIKGIPEIISHDIYYGNKGISSSGLSGGRYRPVAMIVFALEYQFFGANPLVSHLINILFFALLIALLFKLLQKYIFSKQHHYLAFVTCLLFVVHPIHTEVIANVKSRDELITFIFLIAASLSFIKFLENKSTKRMLSGLVFFFLALLTRESAVPFVAIAPLAAYFFLKQSLKKSLQLFILLLAMFLAYMALRMSLVGFSQPSGSGILNSPFLYASTSEAFATKVYILFKYLWLLIFPHPLSSDYGYNQIPYVAINSFSFLLSLGLYLSLIGYALFNFSKKSILSFCILYFLISIFLFSNFIFDIGAPLAERILFQPSLSICIVIAVLYLKTAHKFKVVSTTVFLIILFLFSIKTVTRNADWKSNETLYSADVISSPYSIKTNICAAKNSLLKASTETDECLKIELLKKAVFYNERILKIYNYDRSVYEDLGLAYLGLKEYCKAADNWMIAYRLNPSLSDSKKRIEVLSDLLFNEGNNSHKMGHPNEAIRYYKKSVELNDKNVDAWYNLSKSYALINDTLNANYALQIAIKLSSNK